MDDFERYKKTLDKEIHISTWLKKKSSNPELCKPCFLPLLATWYAEELREKGQPGLADIIEMARQEPNMDEKSFAQILDSIREDVCDVDSQLCQRLTEFNLAMFESEKKGGMVDATSQPGPEDTSGS
jgi:hypothetical protein